MKKQNRIVFFVGVIVLITVAIQLYWNQIQYENNKQQVVNEVENALNNAVDDYYNELSKKTLIAYAYGFKRDTIKKMDAFGVVTEEIISSKIAGMYSDTLIKGEPKFDKDFEELSKKIQKETFENITYLDRINGTFDKNKEIKLFKGNEQIDSLKNLEDAVVKAVASFPFEKIDFLELKKQINKELNKKNIRFDYSLIQKDKANKTVDSSGVFDHTKLPFIAISKSTLLPNKNTLELHYPDVFWATLKKGIIGIVLSLVLSGMVVFSLFYLLHIIRKQKQLSEIKNDFISNITHELKTPIATITSAIEGIRNFNEDNNPEKNKKYLEVAAQQLDKLKILVEKIMETSIIESKNLNLEKENTDLIQLIKDSIDENKLNTHKKIELNSNVNEFNYKVDEFHFKNAISNLIENAAKYGGNEITVCFNLKENKAEIEIIDNGNEIPKEHQKMIFDKFYRIPNKNKHNVKGFGIGLHYTQNVIEKHNGIIELKSDKNKTTFSIKLQ